MSNQIPPGWYPQYPPPQPNSQQKTKRKQNKQRMSDNRLIQVIGNLIAAVLLITIGFILGQIS